ncbi:MAG TPA: GGDEF domain-containing phosphodiesterase, partial [Beijerinckiaceae bacterium]|nr:GGDEF domain-containing phosphodiesterase [Beijerinckiaceae bacterium]
MGGPTPARYSASASEGNATSRGLDPRAILTSLGGVVYDWDVASDSITWGLNAAEVFGVSDLSELSCGKSFALASESDAASTRHEVILNSETSDEGSGVAYRANYKLRVKPGCFVTVEDTGRWYAATDGRPAFAHGVVRIDRSNASEADGSRSGKSQDRSDFLAQIRNEVAETARGKRSLALLVVAIEDLAELNEELGFEGADTVIHEVMRRIRTVMRRRDKLMRYSGNRIAIALLSCPSEQLEGAISRLTSVVAAEPIETPDGTAMARLCIGAACAPDHAADAPALLRRAEDALAAAKHEAGRSAIYSPALTRGAARASLEPRAIDVVDALNTRRVLMARQPVVEARSRSLAFSEALVRLRSVDGRIVNAADLLPAVERAGLVPLIDARMLEMAAKHLAAHPEERLSINVSPYTIETADWLSTLAAHLGARPGIASRLIIEVTETAAFREPETTRARLDAMKALGVAIAIDDFGTGHTSFKHLRSFPVDILKIDGAFVQNLSR